MKILHIINNFNIGGAETLLKNYAIHNQNADVVIEICTLKLENSFIVEELKCKCKIFDLNLQHKYNFISAIYKLNQIIRKGNYDCVHVHLFPGQYYGSVLARLNKSVPFIFTEHSTSNKRRNNRFFIPLEKISYRSYKKIICVSKMARESLINWIPDIAEKTEILYGGIVLSEPMNKSKKYDVVLVGSLREAKGVDILIRAVKLLEDKITRVAIVGDGILKPDLIALTKDLGLEQIISFEGHSNNVQEYLSSSKIFVLPSRWEGFGLAIVEAMNSNIPVIASRVGGIPEIVTHGINGLLFEKENVIELSRLIIELLSDNNKVDYLTRNAYITATEQFSISTHCINLNKIYTKLLTT